LAFLTFGVTAPARADDAVTAREHYQKGTSNYDLGRYADAIKEFEAAYEIKNDPALLYNLAQSHRLAGNSEQALHFYRTYLRYVPKAPNRAEIESRIAQLDQQVNQKNAPPSTPPSQTSPPAATTPSIGTEPGASPYPIPPEATPAMPPAAMPPSEPPPGMMPPGPATEPNTTMTTPPPPSADRVHHAQVLKKVGWISAAAGGGLFVIGALYGAAAVNAGNQINNTAKAGGTYDPAVQDRGKSAQTAEAVFMVLGALVAAGGGALYFYGRNQEQVAVTAVASSTQVGAALSVRF
jgi:tetratricopeptide (TPR) repeat protein